MTLRPVEATTWMTIAPDVGEQEARSALTALGYKPAEVQRFTEAAYKDGMSTEQIIQEALKRAVR